MAFHVKHLPPENLDESKLVLRKLASAHRFLAELKGVAATIPNQAILINTLALQEAKDSSAIENIITTHDELFKAQLFLQTCSIPPPQRKLVATSRRSNTALSESKRGPHPESHSTTSVEADANSFPYWFNHHHSFTLVVKTIGVTPSLIVNLVEYINRSTNCIR